MDGNERFVRSDMLKADRSKIKIDNTQIYEYSFYVMNKFIKETKEKSNVRWTSIARPLIGLKDDNAKQYDQIVQMISKGITVELGQLIMRLLTLYDIDYTPFEYTYDCGVPLPFYRNESGRKTGYIFFNSFSDFFNFPKKNLSILLEKKKIDCVKALILSEKIDKVLEEGYRRITEISGCDPISYITIIDFFSLFPENEYDIFKSYIEKFNRELKMIIGHQTIIMPSEDIIDTLKDDLKDELKTLELDKTLKEEGLFDKNIRRIEDNYWGRGLYKASLGDSHFAESLISSEWYYQTHVDYSAIEQSAIITGYLKSVEQLLFALVRLSIDTGRTIKKTHSGYIEYSSENEKEVDATMGSLSKYLGRKDNKDLWDFDSYAQGYMQKYVIRKLDEYRDEYRNGYFHKDDIFSMEEIEEIRYNTLLMHYLLLGCIKIEEDDKEKLGVRTELQMSSENDYKLSYERLEMWLDRILGCDNLIPTTGKVTFDIRSGGRNRCGLLLKKVKKINEKGFPIDTKMLNMKDELIWEKTKEDEQERYVLLFLRKYLESGKFAYKLKAYSKVFAYVRGQYVTIWSKQPCD